MKARLLLLSHDNALTGAPICLARLALSLARLPGAPEIRLGFPGPGPFPRSLAAAAGAFRYRLRRFPGAVSVADPGARKAFRRVLGRLRPSLVIANTLETHQAVLAAAELGIPSLWLLHERMENYRSRRELPAMRAAAGAAGKIVFNSLSSLRGLPVLGEGLEARAVFLHPGVEIPPVPARPFSGDGEISAGCVGDICLPKGQLELVAELAPLLGARTGLRLFLIGRTPKTARDYRRRLEDSIRDRGLEGRVILSGESPDGAGEIARLDLLIHAARLESFGLAILEAMASGIPVVARDSGGPGEIVVPGETGLLAAPDVPGALRAGVEELLRDPARARRMGEKGRERARDRFSLENYARAVMNLSEDILKEAL